MVISVSDVFFSSMYAYRPAHRPIVYLNFLLILSNRLLCLTHTILSKLSSSVQALSEKRAALRRQCRVPRLGGSLYNPNSSATIA